MRQIAEAKCLSIFEGSSTAPLLDEIQYLARFCNGEAFTAERRIRCHASQRNRDSEMGNDHPPGCERRSERVTANQRKNARSDQERS